MLTELKHFGLSDKEAKVYLAMLELGPATIVEIAVKAGVNRPTTYVEIESLKKKGLASTQIKGNKRLFIAESPTQFEFLLDRDIKTIEQKRETLTKVLPELNTLFNLGDQKPQVRFFEGKEGLMRMQEEFLKTKGKEILAISNLDDVFKIFPTHPQTYSVRRLKRKIHARLLYTSKKGPVYHATDKKMLRQSKYVSSTKLPFTADITIFDDKVAIAALRGRIAGAIIEHKEIADSFRGLFDFIWKTIN